MNAIIDEADAPAIDEEKSALVIRRFRAGNDECECGEADEFVFDAPGLETQAAECAGIVLPEGNETRATTLLAAGAPRVYLGGAVLLDSTLVERLVAAYGTERIGIYAPLRRQTVSWSFETVSNADFKTVTPSHCEPAWEVLWADGSGTGTLASWWLKTMGELGASSFLVRVDIRDDTDLNLCAGLVEELGEALWLGPLTDPAPALAEWVDFGQCRQLALPVSLYAQLHAAPAQQTGLAP